MPAEDLQMTRRCQREIGKRVAIDGNLINVRAIHGVVYLTGRARLQRGAMNVNIEEEMNIIAQNIRRLPGVRDVVMEVTW